VLRVFSLEIGSPMKSKQPIKAHQNYVVWYLSQKQRNSGQKPFVKLRVASGSS
jgi:hypothetical protein